MKRKFFLAGCILATFFMLACDEYTEDLTDVAILITPVASETLNVNAGDNVRYEIEMHTTHNYIARIEVTSFDKVQNFRVVKDTTFTGHQDRYYFYYRAPLFNEETTPVTLHFTAWDDAGSKSETDRKLIVTGRQILLQEKTGIVLRNAAKGENNAISFTNPTQPFLFLPPVTTDEGNEASSNADLYIMTDDDFSNTTVSSDTKAKFVRYNSFDYSNATAYNIQSVYESSRREDMVDQLKVNDVILVGHDSQAEGVLFVTNIVHFGNDKEKCVQLSLKSMENH